MQEFYGTKRIAAKPMNRDEYNDFRGWELPADENGADEGYLVEYLDGGKPNVEGFAGYVSWSPKEQFENAYQPINALNFGHALMALKEGKKLQRAGWNGPDQFVVYQKAYPDGIPINANTAEATGLAEGTICKFRPYLMLKTAQNDFCPWVPSISDVLAEDWQVI